MKKIWKITAFVLVLSCLVGAVAGLTVAKKNPLGDLNGDGRVTAYDAQLRSEYEAGKVAQSKLEGATDDSLELLQADQIMDLVFERADLKDKDTNPNDDITEIWTIIGMYAMAQNPSGNYKLMANIDMGGLIWDPVYWFVGTLDGNGKTISNLYVENTADDLPYQGLIGKLGAKGTVKNLHLENAIIQIAENAQYVGLLVGSATGKIENCTTTGAVIDERTALPRNLYVGTIVGRIENADTSVAMTLSNSLTATAGSGLSQDKVSVVSKMAMFYGDLDGSNKYTRTTGVAGFAPSGKKPTNCYWQDTTGSIEWMDPVLAQRRQSVVDKMYEICTVEWTPSQDMTIHYFKTSSNQLRYSTKTWKAGETYRGIPYNHGSGSLERFEAWTEVNSSGKRVTKTTLPTVAYYISNGSVIKALNADDSNMIYVDPSTGTSYDLSAAYNLPDQPFVEGEKVESADHAGFSRYIGNDCSSAISWAWRSLVSSDVATGGTAISGVTQMAATTSHQKNNGVLPVNGMVPTSINTADWNQYAQDQGETAFFETYAKASRGDALASFPSAGAHSRMIAYDPMTIRNYAGVIQEKMSYIITHEQGRSSSGGILWTSWSSTCSVNTIYTFDQLYNYADYESGIGTRGYYLPSTLPVFHDVNSKAVASTLTLDGNVISSNFHILSTTVDGVEVFTNVSQHATTNSVTRVGSGYRDAHVTENLATAHGDVTGKTVKVRLANGDVYMVNMTTGQVTKQ